MFTKKLFCTDNKQQFDRPKFGEGFFPLVIQYGTTLVAAVGFEPNFLNTHPLISIYIKSASFETRCNTSGLTIVMLDPVSITMSRLAPSILPDMTTLSVHPHIIPVVKIVAGAFD